MKIMLNLTIIFVSAGFLTACETKQQALAQNTQSQYAVDERSVLQDVISSKRRIATGFFVTDDGYFITNYHVVQGANQIYITTANGNRVPAKIVKENRPIDIVLCKADVHGKRVNWSTHQGIEKGGEVLTLGYPLMVIQGSEQKATFGRINSFSGIRGDPGVYQVDVPVQPGNSGGPLISENGTVIGVMKATFNQLAALETIGTLTQNINYAVKSDQILPMLRETLGDKIKISGNDKSRQDMPHLINKFERSVIMVEAE
jgi:S1-C subfamily serine protease